MCWSRKYPYPPIEGFWFEYPTPLEIPVKPNTSFKYFGFEIPHPFHFLDVHNTLISF